jgi:hypothetical protein
MRDRCVGVEKLTSMLTNAVVVTEEWARDCYSYRIPQGKKRPIQLKPPNRTSVTAAQLQHNMLHSGRHTHNQVEVLVLSQSGNVIPPWAQANKCAK